MTQFSRLATMLLAAALLVMPAMAQDSAGSDLDVLLKRFRNLYQSLNAQGGFTEDERPTIEALHEEVASYRQANPGEAKAIALDLQLAMWLNDDDEVNELFEALYETSDNKALVGRSWSEYFIKKNDDERLGGIYERLEADNPDDGELQLRIARREKSRNDFAAVIERLERADLDFAKHPQAAILLSDAYFAEHRFDESVAVLREIPDSTRGINVAIGREVDRLIPEREPYATEYWPAEQEKRAAEASADDNPRAKIITSRGDIVIELFEDDAPNTVANFISLAESGFYEGIKYHRVIPNYLAQVGDPRKKGVESLTDAAVEDGPGYRIPDEHLTEPYRLHFAGSVSMANRSTPNSGGSEFMILHMPLPWLNGQHTVFGRVIEGLDVARAIEVDDVVERVEIIRKRDHAYEVQKLLDE